ncbi:MAG: pyridoxal-phosphate dependent enzyme [Gemmatimonadota bacterium]|nr:pyridoxal-phosphate dependent enzyme [Gemmatimonadota bacterium]
MRSEPAVRDAVPHAARLPSIDDIRAATARVADVAVRTPLIRLGAGLDSSSAVWLKGEHRQPIRAFKIRGAANAMRSVPPESLRAGVWTASAGNMAQGVAYVAREMGVPCRVVVPDHAPRAKLDAIAALGAKYVKVPFEVWWQAMLTHAHPGMDGLMVHPFADPAVMAGNGTIGLELAEDAPDLDAVLVPWGGGGLALGIAAALREVSPRTKVYAVEVETAAPLTASLAAGRPVTVVRTPTWIDGMGSDRVSNEMWPLVRGLIAGTVVVTLAQVAAALRLVHEATGDVVEGAGAAAVAAAFHGTVHPAPGTIGAPESPSLDARRVACIISGGNIDREVVDRILQGELS